MTRPTILEIEAEASTQRAARRVNWGLYRRMSLDTAEELLRKGAIADQEAGLQEYVQLEKRRLRGYLEAAEKAAEFRERSALPIAVGIGFAGGWFNSLAIYPASWAPWVTLAFNAIGAGVWWFRRRSALRQISSARRQLARLGRVD